MSPARSATAMIVAIGWATTLVGINAASTTATLVVPHRTSVVVAGLLPLPFESVAMVAKRLPGAGVRVSQRINALMP
jgi:hypothetical protein